MAHRKIKRGVAAVRWAAVFGLVVVLGGCTQVDNFLASIPTFTFMRESPAFDPYEAPRPAPPNAVPYAAPGGAVVLPDVEPTDASLRQFAEEIGGSPIPMTEETIARGQELFDELCVVCHGPQGRGDGTIIAPDKFPMSRDLTAPIARNLSDGYIYGIIRVGRGLMPNYAVQTTHMERWYIVNYVRYLQQQAQAAGSAEGRE